MRLTAVKSLICLAGFFSVPAFAQVRVVGPGSTVQGDVLRGEGVFLQGAGWYDLNEAKARSIDANTNIQLDRWNRIVNEAYRQEYAAEKARQKASDKAKRDKQERQRAEHEMQLRTNPTPGDIQKGEALNALLLDLSDPKVKAMNWYTAKVELPPDLTIRKLVFRFATHPSDKGAGELAKALISIGRLDKSIDGSGWPIFLRDPRLSAERLAYERAYRDVVDHCLAKSLTMDDAIKLRRSVDAVRVKANNALPNDLGTRNSALQYVDDMKKATDIFHSTTIDFAQEIIADTREHEAHTVAELRGFMRKYRLLFAPAGKQPGDGEVYERLYGLLRDQKDALGLKTDLPMAKSAIPVDAKEFSGRRYKVYGEMLSWHGAKAKCEEMGGHLAIVRNDRENRFIASLMRDNSLDLAWLGATDEKFEGKWLWVDGTSMAYNAWDAKEPNNRGPKGLPENYAFIQASKGELWHDIADEGVGKWRPGFVCEWDDKGVAR